MFACKISKGCVVFAAFFLMSACEDSNDRSKQPLQQQKVIEQTVETNKDKPKKDITNQNNEDTELNNEPLNPTSDIYLSKNPKSEPQDEAFSCDDQIYLAIKFANHQPKLQQINISWKDPNGTEREKNSFPFFVTQKESLAWASLKLHRSVGAGMLQWINPAAGMEEFIGTWSVDVSVGTIVNKSINFEVLC